MLKGPLSILSKTGTVGLILYLGWLCWANLGPQKPEIGPIRRELADRLIPGIVEDIRNEKGDIHQTAFLHFGNDPTNYLTDNLRSTIEQNGVLDLYDQTFMEKLRDVLNLRQPSFSETEDAIEAGQKLGVQSVLYGNIFTFESYPGGVLIDIEVKLTDISTGEVVFTERYSTEASRSEFVSAEFQELTGSYPWFQRLFGWLIAVLLLPVFTIGFIRAMVRKKSNQTNAFVLAIYTLVDALLAWLLVGAVLNTWLTVVVFIVAIAAAFLYNVRIMTFALRLEDE